MNGLRFNESTNELTYNMQREQEKKKTVFAAQSIFLKLFGATTICLDRRKAALKTFASKQKHVQNSWLAKCLAA